MIEAALVSCDDHLDLNMLPADLWQKRMARYLSSVRRVFIGQPRRSVPNLR